MGRRVSTVSFFFHRWVVLGWVFLLACGCFWSLLGHESAGGSVGAGWCEAVAS